MDNFVSPPSRLTRLLDAWGTWHERELLRSSYPAVNVLFKIAQTGIPEPFQPGHRVLARDMPPKVQRIQRAWLAMATDDARRVIWVKYVCDRDEKGAPLTDAQRAGLLECSLLDFKGLVLSARRELRRILRTSLAGIEAANG